MAGKNKLIGSKSNRTLNPTDKMRRQQRKKELKKNKKQRNVTREEIIKSKDPDAIIQDILKVNDQEINSIAENLTNDKVYNEKKRKLRNILDDLIKYYAKLDPEKHSQLKQAQTECEQKCREAWNNFYAKYQEKQDANSKKNNSECNQISLPSEILSLSGNITLADIPLPTESSENAYNAILKVSSIVKDMNLPGNQQRSEENTIGIKKYAEIKKLPNNFKCPAPPPLPIPLSAVPINTISGVSNIYLHETEKHSTIHSLAQKHSTERANIVTPTYTINPPNLSFYPPPPPQPLIQNFHASAEPIKYTSNVPAISSDNSDLNIANLCDSTSSDNTSVVSKSFSTPTYNSEPVISAQPKLRNTREQVTKLVPVSVRMKKDIPTSQSSFRTNETLSINEKNTSKSFSSNQLMPSKNTKNDSAPQKSKDEVYTEFMKEMEGLL